MASHLRPRGVGIPRALRASARARNVFAPLFWISAMIGRTFAAWRSALALRAVAPALVAAYQRSSMLERRRPIMAAWATYVCGSDADNVVPLMARRGSAQ